MYYIAPPFRLICWLAPNMKSLNKSKYKKTCLSGRKIYSSNLMPKLHLDSLARLLGGEKIIMKKNLDEWDCIINLDITFRVLCWLRCNSNRKFLLYTMYVNALQAEQEKYILANLAVW